MLSNKKIYCEGQALLTAVIFFSSISLVIVLSLSASAINNSKITANALNAKKSYFAGEAGSEDAIYRVKEGKKYSSTEAINLDGTSATTTISSIGSDVSVESEGNSEKNIRKIKALLTTSTGASFNYGAQVGDGGIILENSSSVAGNIYSNGTVDGAGSNLIKGDVISAGATGLIEGIHATSSAYAHTISDSEIDNDAHYQHISGTIVLGTLYPNSPDQPILELPISDEIIDLWKQAAVINIINSPCPYIIDDDASIGPVKINCDLEINGSPIITLNGMIWVNGNITIKNTAIIRINASLGRKSVALIADNPLNRITSSKISLENSATFYGSGESGSYVLFVSENNSAESEGSEKAITIQNSANGKLLLYAGHGEILMKNSSSLKEVTGYRIRLQNSAQVFYESGLASLLFESGPAGSFSINLWREIR